MGDPCSFSIRAGVSEDAEMILAFIRDLAAFENLTHEVSATAEQLRRHLFTEPRRAEVLLPCENNRAVGFAIFFLNFSTFLGRPGLYLEDIYIAPEHRGKGYARALMIQLARIARERDCGRFEWAVLDWNERALDFYRSLGATPLSEWTLQRVSGDALASLAERPLFEKNPGR